MACAYSIFCPRALQGFNATTKPAGKVGLDPFRRAVGVAPAGRVRRAADPRDLWVHGGVFSTRNRKTAEHPRSLTNPSFRKANRMDASHFVRAKA
jgi:hypothetical protein